MSHCHNKFSRRRVIKFMALGATAPIISTLIGQAQAAKASKGSVEYRDEPNGEEQCSNCMQFIPGKTPETNGKCKVVEGGISPRGWCTVYVKKS